MQKHLAILILTVALFCPARILFSQTPSQGIPSWDSNAQKAWWAKNPTPDTWPQAADALQAQLEADYKQNGAHVFSDSDFQGWLDQLKWIRLGLDCPDVLADANRSQDLHRAGPG